MDTEAIAREIVQIRNRLGEIDKQLEGGGDTDVDDERQELHQRLLQLQDELSAHGSGEGRQDSPGQPDSVQYVPPS